MPTLTVTTNIPPVSGGNFQYRYRKLSGGAWSSWIVVATNPFNFTTPDPLGTNYSIETYMECKPGVSTTSTFNTNFTCSCGIISLTNLVVSGCNVLDNTYSVTLDVTYTCMRNDLNVITSVIKAQVDGNIFYFNPTVANGTQSITLTGLSSTGGTKTLSITCLPS